MVRALHEAVAEQLPPAGREAAERTVQRLADDALPLDGLLSDHRRHLRDVQVVALAARVHERREGARWEHVPLADRARLQQQLREHRERCRLAELAQRLRKVGVHDRLDALPRRPHVRVDGCTPLARDGSVAVRHGEALEHEVRHDEALQLREVAQRRLTPALAVQHVDDRAARGPQRRLAELPVHQLAAANASAALLGPRRVARGAQRVDDHLRRQRERVGLRARVVVASARRAPGGARLLPRRLDRGRRQRGDADPRRHAHELRACEHRARTRQQPRPDERVLHRRHRRLRDLRRDHLPADMQQLPELRLREHGLHGVHVHLHARNARS